MIVFTTLRTFKVILLVVLIICIPQLSFGSKPKVTNWKVVKILNGFKDAPNEKVFRVSGPTIRPLDTRGAELIFRITPKDDPSCTQTFKLGWKFNRDVAHVREGESFSVQLFNYPAGDAGVGLRKCYVEAKSRAGDGGLTRLSFHPSTPTHFIYQAQYKKYHEKDAQYLFSKTTNVRWVDPIKTRSALDGFLVYDSSIPNKPGVGEAQYGSLSFRIDKGGVFRYNITYLYDALTGPPPKKACETFSDPMTQGYRLDGCLRWGQDCGEPAATAWCRTQGFDRATGWQVAKSVPPTYVLGSGQVCNQQFCSGFSTITCCKGPKKGLNLNSYCGKKFGGSFKASNPKGGCHSWICTDGRASYGMDINEACRMQHGSGYKALARGQGANCWECVR